MGANQPIPIPQGKSNGKQDAEIRPPACAAPATVNASPPSGPRRQPDTGRSGWAEPQTKALTRLLNDVRGRTPKPETIMRNRTPPVPGRWPALWMFAFVSPVLAQTDTPVPSLDPVIVTATRSPERLENTIGDNSVVDRAKIDRMPDGTLAEILGAQRGITFVNRGGPQTLSTINLRGTGSAQSLVLVDGMRVNSPTNGLPVLNAIPLNAIERIEIVRGASSSLYGADAIGGVINVITRKPGKDAFSAYASAGVGTYASSEYTAGLSGSQNGWSYSLYSGYGQSAGFSATNADSGPNTFNSDNDSYYRSNLGGQLGYEWRAGQTISVQTLQSRVNAGYDSFYVGTPAFNDRSVQTLSNTILNSTNQIGERWQSNLSVSFLQEKNQSRNDASGAGQGYFQSRQNQYQWLNTLTVSTSQTLTVGYERLEQSAQGFAYGEPVDFAPDAVYTNALLAAYSGRWGIHHVQASVRNDSNSQYGNFTTGSVAYAIDVTPQWRASVAANTAFRAPTFNELYYPFYGNPNLSPERSRNLEAGLRYLHSSGEISITGFYNRITDLIVSRAPLFVPTNVDTATIRGVSLAMEQVIGVNTSLNAGLDLLSPYNSTTGTLLPFIAQRVLRLGGTHKIADLMLSADWYLTSGRVDGANNRLGGYGLLNLGVTYSVNRHIDLQMRWNNVLGKNYTLAQGYNTPGSNVFFNIAIHR